MRIDFEHAKHPHIEEHRQGRAPRRSDTTVGLNGRIALVLTAAVGTMWCAYLFTVLALVALPDAMRSTPRDLIQWVSQTFIQLVMLSVIMVGQNILSQASDKRAEMTYKDAEATFHESKQIQAHLKVQDDAMNAMLERLERLEGCLTPPTKEQP
jgi:hypothetical protein